MVPVTFPAISPVTRVSIVFFDWVSCKQVLRPFVAVSTAGADDGSAAVDFHPQRVTAALGRLAEAYS